MAGVTEPAELQARIDELVAEGQPQQAAWFNASVELGYLVVLPDGSLEARDEPGVKFRI